MKKILAMFIIIALLLPTTAYANIYNSPQVQVHPIVKDEANNGENLVQVSGKGTETQIHTSPMQDLVRIPYNDAFYNNKENVFADLISKSMLSGGGADKTYAINLINLFEFSVSNGILLTDGTIGYTPHVGVDLTVTLPLTSAFYTSADAANKKVLAVALTGYDSNNQFTNAEVLTTTYTPDTTEIGFTIGAQQWNSTPYQNIAFVVVELVDKPVQVSDADNTTAEQPDASAIVAEAFSTEFTPVTDPNEANFKLLIPALTDNGAKRHVDFSMFDFVAYDDTGTTKLPDKPDGEFYKVNIQLDAPIILLPGQELVVMHHNGTEWVQINYEYVPGSLTLTLYTPGFSPFAIATVTPLRSTALPTPTPVPTPAPSNSAIAPLTSASAPVLTFEAIIEMICDFFNF